MRKRMSVLFLSLMAGSALAAPSQMSVTVKETVVRATPSYLGTVVGKLLYGDRVQIIASQTGWAHVSKGGTDGWVSLSALTEKTIVLKAGAENVSQSASSGEVALAGKGFNKEVEAKYKSDTKLDYTAVDRMEQYGVTPEEIAAFFQDGGLSPNQGGAQ